jgi:hypothetical protein
MTRMLASGEASAAALARSRTIEALVLKRSANGSVSNRACVDKANEHTVTGHARLARNTSRDEDDLRALESLAETRGSRLVATDGAVGVDVAQISSDTCRNIELACWKIGDLAMLVSDVRRRTRATADIIESKLRNTGVELEQERERLANATSGAEDSDLGGLKMKMDIVSTLLKLRGTEPSDERIGLHTWLAEAEKARFWRRLMD